MLGEKLVTIRKKYGYSQQELADRLSVTRQTISNWECGQGAPALDKAIELARIYQVSLDDLVGDQVGVVVKEKKRLSQRILKCLIGKYVKISYSDMELLLESDFETGSDSKVKVLDVTDEWIRTVSSASQLFHKFQKFLCPFRVAGFQQFLQNVLL